MADENELDGIKISELDSAGAVDNDNDYLVISQQGNGVYTSEYKSYKIHPNQLASQGVTYTAGDFINIDSSNVISATYQNATESDSGLMSAADKTKLNGIEAGANDYSLPVATDSVLGGVKQGTNVSIDANGTISATDTTYTAGTNVQISDQNVISATDTTYSAGTNIQISAGNVISATDTVYTLPPATTSTLGGVIIGSGVNVAADGTISVSGGGGGASALDDLTDVDISSPTADQVLKYDSVNSKWINGNVSGGGGATALSGLTDVDLGSTIAAAQSLIYDDTTGKWKNAYVNYSNISGTPTLATVATSGSYADLSNKPTIPAAQVNSDWNSSSGVSEILNKPNLATVATSGAYSDLSGTPTLATVATSGSYTDLSNKPTIPDGLADLTDDVNISSPTDGQILKYDGTSSKWVNGTGGGGGASALDDLTDVDITTPTEGQTLVYDSTNSKWVNGAGGGGGSAKQTALTQTQYDALVTAGTVDPTMEYFITDGIPAQAEPMHHYSTVEQVVGTWIDGSTLYERVFDLGSELDISRRNWTTTAITGLAKTVSAVGFGQSGSQYPLISRVVNDTVDLLACREGENAYCTYIYLRYTKSSS